MSSMVDKQEIIDMIRIKSPRLELVSFEAGKSEAWRWFKRVRVDGAVLPYAVCNGCFKPVHYTPRDGTGGLRRHACPLTVAMAQAKTGLNSNGGNSSNNNHHGKAPSASPNGNSKKQRAGTPDHHGVQQQPSPRSRNQQRRSATVPVSLTMWAAEKGLMDLTQAAAAAAGLPSGGLSIASAFAALQGIVPRWGEHHHHGHHPQGVHHHLQPTLPQPMDGGSPKMADSALDLAMKKSTDVDDDDRPDEDRDEEEDAVLPLEHRHHHAMLHHPSDRAQSIVDHILLNIQQQTGKASGLVHHDANQNEQNGSSRFSIVPPSRSSSSSSMGTASTRRPRKRSNPDRAIPTSNGSSNGILIHRTNGGGNGTNGHPDIEANLQMLAQVANANDSPAVKRERISSPDALDAFRYQMNGGQLTPTSQHSVPSPADEDGDHHHHHHLHHPRGSGSSSGEGGSRSGRSTTGSAKSGTSSPAQFLLVNNVPASSTSPPAHLMNVPSSSSAASTAAVESNDETAVALGGDLLRSSQLTKPVESFVAAMHQVLQGSPQCSLADAAQLIQLNDLTTCLHSLLDLHKKSLSAIENKMPVPDLQKPAPRFQGIAVVDGQFKEISLDDYKGKYVVLFFYPLDFTFVCPTEILAFSDRADEFRKIGCELIACSTDSHFCHLAWINTARKQGGLGSLNLPLLADKSAAIAKAYGVYKEDEGLAFRGLFIIDEQQILRQVTINDLPVGRSVDETLRLVQAFQFTDKHGEVCPAGWTPGKKTMKADPAGSKEYFETSN